MAALATDTAAVVLATLYVATLSEILKLCIKFHNATKHTCTFIQY